MKQLPFIFVLLIFLSGTIYAQSYTAVTGLEYIKSKVAHASKKDRNRLICSEFKKLNTKDFSSEQEYWSFLCDLTEELNPQVENYYDDLFSLAKELSFGNKKREAFPIYSKILQAVEAGVVLKERCKFYQTLGDIYFFFKRYDEASNVFSKAINCQGVSGDDLMNVYNTMGLLNMVLDPSLAEIYYQKGIEVAQKEKNDIWFGLLNGNLGSLYLKQGKFDKAKGHLLIDAKYSLDFNLSESAVGAYSSLLRVYLKENEIGKAAECVRKMDSLSKHYNIEVDGLDYFFALSKWHSFNGRYKEAFEANSKGRMLLDSIDRVRNDLNFQNMRFQIDFEQRRAEIQLLEEQRKSGDRIMKILIALIASIVIGGALAIYQILKRKKKDREILELKNKQVTDNLKRLDDEMKELLFKLVEKNETISNLNQELLEYSHSITENSQDKLDLTSKLQAFTLLTDEDWFQYKRLFEKRFPGFIGYLQNSFDGITNAELRLATLLKIDLETVEMAKVLGISADSVRKTNLRLRKRMGIEDQNELLALIKNDRF